MEKKPDGEQAQGNQSHSQEKFHIEVLQNILDLHMNLHEATYNSANFLIGMTGIILAIIISSIPKLDDYSIQQVNLAKVGIFILAFSCLIALLICLKIINPTIENKSSDEETNLFYYVSFLSNCTEYNYGVELSKLIKDEKYITKQYALEIYNLSECVLKPKFKELKYATLVLMIGITFGISLLVISIW